MTVKQTYAHPEKAGARGYTPFGKETAVGETTPDLKEFWHHGPMVDDSYDSRISENIQFQKSQILIVSSIYYLINSTCLV